MTGADGGGCGAELTPCATIQQAVDLASSGDTILVAEGLYTDDVDCLGEAGVVCVFQKELVILGGFASGDWGLPQPATNTTIIDGQDQRRGLLIRRGGADPGLPVTSLRLEGFTVRNGRAVGNPNGLGGGLKANFADMVLRDMVFRDNVAIGGAGGQGGGGGAAIQGDANNIMNVTLERVLFQTNTGTGGGDSGGAGLGGGLLIDHAVVTALDVDFQSNAITGGASASTGKDGLGGALAFSFGVTATVADLTANANTATGGSGSSTGGFAFGGAIFLEGAESLAGDLTTVSILDSNISGNTALGGNGATAGGGSGGGIDAFGAQLTLRRTTVTGNHAEGGVGNSAQGSAGGGGVFLEWPFSSAPRVHEVRNSILADNTLEGAQGGGGGLRLLGTEANVIHVTVARNQLLGTGFGAGILVGPRLTQASSMTLSSSILADHTVPAGTRALHVQSTPSAGSDADLTTLNLFVGNSNDTNAGLPNSGTFTGFPGSNIQDPSASTFFVNPVGLDYRIDGTMPPTDSATGSSEALDFEGAVRTGSRDLGADEFGAAAFLLAVGKQGPGSGTVTSNPAGIDCGPDCSEIYAEDTSVTLSAVPDGGSSFSGWTGSADCGDGSVLMDQDHSCIAQFETGGPPAPCTAEQDNLVLTAQTITGATVEGACVSITAGSGYSVAAAGVVTFEAPLIVLQDGFSVAGTFTAINGTP